MKTLMFTLALATTVATGAYADEDPIAAAAAAAMQQTANVAKTVEAMPEATVKAVEQAEAAKNPPPTEEEMKKDAGVQTVIKMQDKGKFPSEEDAKEDSRAKTAKEQVEKILKKNGIKLTQNKDRIIQVVSVSMPLEDPANDKKFFVKRDQLCKLLVLRMKGAIAASVGQVFSAKEQAQIFGDATNVAVTIKTKAGSTAKWPLFGVTTLAQAESWDGKSYSIAAAAVWSKVLHRAAKATLLGEDLKSTGGKRTVDAWLEENDLALMCGPRQIVDPEGNRVFFGIAAREIGVNDARDMANREAAKASALSYLVFSLYADVEQRMTHAAAAGVYSGEDEKASADAEDKIDLRLSQSVENRAIAGASEIKSVEVVHPLSGKKIYVSVYSLDQNSVANARVMAEELIATRVATELANKRALGRLQGYQDQVNKAKANTEEFEKGRAEGNAAIEKKLAPKNRRVSAVAAPEVKKDAKSQKGTFSGEGSISNDF